MSKKAAITFPPRPDIPPVQIDVLYQYRGRNHDLNGEWVKVISEKWEGAASPLFAHLVEVRVMKRPKGAKKTETPTIETDQTFGCDPRWLSDGGLAPYEKYHNELAAGNKNIKAATVDDHRAVLEDPDAFDQGIIWED